MDKFLNAYNQPKLNQEDINYLNRTMKSNKVEPVIKSLATKKTPGPDGLTAKFYHTFKKELILKLFQEIER
jgi:hypothetical protein